jgi:hypothetical protein
MDGQRVLRRALLAVVLAAAVGGCGSSEVRTVTVSETSPAPTPSASSPAAKPPAKHRQRHKARAAVVSTPTPVSSPRFVACDSNIKARAATTTCGFAQNTFYEYWASAEAPAIEVYSPATHSTFSTTCTAGEGAVVCTTTDGGVVRFSQAAVDRYSQSQADAYAASHDLGPGSPAATTPAPSDSSPPSSGDDPNFCDTHDCIPNYPNGNGYTVQCADGTYSDSGGIQGACSHHGGVG